jgi:hypothetical protein
MNAEKHGVECADGYLGEWATLDREDADRHAKNLDGFCACRGPHRVVVWDYVD